MFSRLRGPAGSPLRNLPPAPAPALAPWQAAHKCVPVASGPPPLRSAPMFRPVPAIKAAFTHTHDGVIALGLRRPSDLTSAAGERASLVAARPPPAGRRRSRPGLVAAPRIAR